MAIGVVTNASRMPAPCLSRRYLAGRGCAGPVRRVHQPAAGGRNWFAGQAPVPRMPGVRPEDWPGAGRLVG
jgi:hypothetical protein